ncbi:MAG: twin-arginine translocase subunit TatC [Bacillota bacterium]
MAKTSKSMSIVDHLNELRRRILVSVAVLLIATIACFVYAGPILAHLTRGVNLIYIRPPEAMMAHIRVAFTAGLAISSPLILYQIIAFLLPALTRKEKKVLLAAVFLMFILFFAGVAFAWFVAFPFAINFFAEFSSDQLLPYYTVGEYVGFVTGFLLGFGLVFQLPLLFWLLGALGLITASFLRASRKYALILILIVAAVITPPDVVSQVLMGIPMLALYELGIILVAMTERSKKRVQEN